MLNAVHVAVILALAPVQTGPAAAKQPIKPFDGIFAPDGQRLPARRLVPSLRFSPVYSVGEVGTPAVVKEASPTYTAEALSRRLQGTVTVQALVLEDGSVGTVAIIKSLDSRYGLDEAALNAARRWSFKPVLKDNAPVRVRVELTFAFVCQCG